jgi:hypothetical protein
MKRLIGNASVYLCAALDAIPCREDGRWYRHGQWGCRWGFSRLWARWVD